MLFLFSGLNVRLPFTVSDLSRDLSREVEPERGVACALRKKSDPACSVTLTKTGPLAPSSRQFVQCHVARAHKHGRKAASPHCHGCGMDEVSKWRIT